MGEGAAPNTRLSDLRRQHGLTQEEYAEALGVTARQVRSWESGTVRCPQTHHLIALHGLHGTVHPEDLGFRSRRTGTPLDTVEAADQEVAVYRRELLRLVAAAAFTAEPVAAIGRLLAPADEPAGRIGTADVARVNQANAALYSTDLLVGGAAVTATALIQQYRDSAALLHGTYAQAATRHAMHSAVSHLGSTIGFMLFDSGEHVRARQIYLSSLRVASEATDRWPLHAIICSEMARQSIHLRAIPEANELIRVARSADPDLNPTARAMLDALHATASAAHGDRVATTTAITKAEDQFAHTDPTNDPEWITWFDDAELHGETGHALALLAQHDSMVRDTAITRLTRSARTHGSTEQRSAALALTRLASIHTAERDATAAATTTNEALDIAIRLRSPRVTGELRHLHETLAPLAASTDVTDSRRRITELVTASAT